MRTFLSLSQEVLLSLLSFCTACSIHGVQTRECGHTSRSPLDTLESAIGFHMRDWWQPTKANFFGHLKKPQIIAALNDAGPGMYILRRDTPIMIVSYQGGSGGHAACPLHSPE